MPLHLFLAVAFLFPVQSTPAPQQGNAEIAAKEADEFGRKIEALIQADKEDPFVTLFDYEFHVEKAVRGLDLGEKVLAQVKKGVTGNWSIGPSFRPSNGGHFGFLRSRKVDGHWRLLFRGVTAT